MKNIESIKVFIVLAITFFSKPIFAQTISFKELNDYVQKVRIGLVDEFFDRFNGNTTHPNIPLTAKDSRSKNLMMLFDLSQFSSKNDPNFGEAELMMSKVIEDSLCINYGDSTWAALAHCKGTLSGKSVKFDLFLTVQQRRGNMYKWVISKADGNLFDITPRNNSDRIMLLPDDHETNFMSLRKMTNEQPFNVNLFMVNGFDYDKTSAFAYLVHSKLLKIEYVDELEFIFTQIPGYIFHLKYFEREKNNAGWLISNFYESTDENKKAFLHALKPFSRLSVENKNIVIEDVKPIRESLSLKKTPSVEEQKAMYEKRLDEKLLMMKDYITFMQKDDSIRSKNVYMAKMENLFVPTVSVFIQKKKKTEVVTISDFCENLINKKYKSVQLDSVYVPVWDDKIANLDQSIYKLEVPSNKRSFAKVDAQGKDIVADKKHMLFVYKEDTEDGFEWLPLLGNLSIIAK